MNSNRRVEEAVADGSPTLSGSGSQPALKKGKLPPRCIPLPGESQKLPKELRVSNYISTTKYTLLTFLPLGLFYQFYRFSNCYFLFVTILQCIPIVSPLHPITAVVPMVFVLAVSMLREGIEDYFRFRDDEK